MLNLIISDIIFENHPDWNEGKLTTEVSRFVNNKGPLADIAQRLKLGDYLIMGTGEEKANRGRENQKILSDALEALLGALWLGSGKNFNFMRTFLLKQFKALGLTDFNQDYEQAVIRRGISEIADDFMASVMPEIYGVEGGPGWMSISEMMKFSAAKKKATKPLTGLAAVLKRSSLSLGDDEEDNEEAEVKESKTAITGSTPLHPASLFFMPQNIKSEGILKSAIHPAYLKPSL